MRSTQDDRYADRLTGLSRAWWKRFLNVQAPYQRHLARQHLGRTLEIGCGIGRNLATLGRGSVGVDHNAKCVEVARTRGFAAFTPAQWEVSDLKGPGVFDSLLLAHVVEHMPRHEAADLLRTHLPAVRPGGRVFFVCPQERGYRSDPTHVRFTSGDDLVALARDAGLEADSWKSFPFPRFAGRVFKYNEFTLLAHKHVK